METNINKTNKTQQKVIGSKLMFKMSIIYTNTCESNKYANAQSLSR